MLDEVCAHLQSTCLFVVDLFAAFLPLMAEDMCNDKKVVWQEDLYYPGSAEFIPIATGAGQFSAVLCRYKRRVEQRRYGVFQFRRKGGSEEGQWWQRFGLFLGWACKYLWGYGRMYMS